MSYIWEKYSINKKYIVGKKICPYIEIFHDTSLTVEVNPLLRFSSIFGSISIEEELLHTDNYKDSIENILFHFLAQLDKHKGLDVSQCNIENIRDEIINGYYGKKAKQLFCLMKCSDQEIILYEIYQRLIHDNQSYFMNCLSKLFPVSSLCFEKNTETYYLYIGVKKTDYQLKKYELIHLLFWNKKMIIEPVWGVHYGIIGTQYTMHINSVQII